MNLADAIQQMQIASSAAAARFLARIAPSIEETDGHWIWRGKMLHGAPVVSKNSGTQTKRATFELFRGPIGNVSLRTMCGMRPCVSPSHLEPSEYPKGGAPSMISAKSPQTHNVTNAERVAELTADMARIASEMTRLGIDPERVLSRLRSSEKRTDPVQGE